MYPGYDPEFIERLFNPIKYLNSINTSQIIAETFVFILAAILIYHGFKTFGKWKTLLFFLGSFFYTGFEENIMIISGKVFGEDAGLIPQTYAFNYQNYILWILAVPVVVYVAWFVVAYSAIHIASYFFKGSLIKTAAFGGFLAMEMDLMIDPIAVRLNWWGWFPAQGETIWIFGIPFSNFLGWFMLIFLFEIYWKKITDKEQDWGSRKCILVFSLGLIPLLIGTVILLGGVTMALEPLYGINVPLPFGG